MYYYTATITTLLVTIAPVPSYVFVYHSLSVHIQTRQERIYFSLYPVFIIVVGIIHIFKRSAYNSEYELLG